MPTETPRIVTENKDAKKALKTANEAAATARKIVKFLETMFNFDINKDGKVGSTRWGVMAIVLCTCVGLSFAVNQWSLERPENAALNTVEVDSEGTLTVIANEASEAILYLQTDQGDDADDIGALAITTAGVMEWRGTSGTNPVMTLDLSSGNFSVDGTLTGLATNGVVDILTVRTNGTIGTTLVVTGLCSSVAGFDATGGDYTMENDEILRNDVDGDVEAIFNDDATTLGQVIVDTSVDSANLADNDLYEIIARGPDSTSNATDYAVIQLKITDITAASENGQIILQTTANGSDVTGMTIGHNAGGTHACTIVGATTLSSTLDVNGAMTCTNLTMDTGSTLTVGGVAGFTGIVTNKSTTVTNIAYFYNGVITNYTTSP